MKGSDLAILLKRAVELVRPDLRAYYRLPVKGRVVKTYASDGNYWADVQPTRNDESDDVREPVIPKVEVPVMWGGPQRGVVCPIPEGTYVAVGFYDGDPDCPYIEHVRWYKHAAPVCEVGGFIIQMAPGCHIKIDAEKNILQVTPADHRTDVGGDMTVAVAGNVTMDVGADASVTVAETASVAAPQINLVGNLGIEGPDGTTATATIKANADWTGRIKLIGNLDVDGGITATGAIMDGGGNSPHHSHP